MKDLKNIMISIQVSVHPDADIAIEKYGFENKHHFIRQCIRALVECYHGEKLIEWPIQLVTRSK